MKDIKNMSEDKEINKLSDLVKTLQTDIGKLLGAKVTVAIINAEAEIKYIDNGITEFSDFIVSFTKGNFKILSVGDHSLPLSGTNIAFFKVSENALVILNSEKGPVGQLLAFKGRMHKYSAQIDEILESISKKVEKKVPVKKAVMVPFLTLSISNKKFGIDEANVLYLVNGENSIPDICEKSKLPQMKVNEILRKYQKKGWIKLKRLIDVIPKQIPKKPFKKPEKGPIRAPMPPVRPPEIEENILNDLEQLMEETQPLEQKSPEPQSNFLPTTTSPAEPVIPTPPNINIPTSFPPPISVTQPPPKIDKSMESPKMATFKENPASDTVFDELKSLLDEIDPLKPTDLASKPPSQTLSGNSLIKELDDSIKNKTYYEEEPLKHRLARLSNMIEKTAEEFPIKEEKTSVQIIGSKAVCPNCKVHVFMMAKICPNCQKPLRICPNCKSPITLFARICPSCGSLL